jgi:hypothetical protein
VHQGCLLLLSQLLGLELLLLGLLHPGLLLLL